MNTANGGGRFSDWRESLKKKITKKPSNTSTPTQANTTTPDFDNIVQSKIESISKSISNLSDDTSEEIKDVKVKFTNVIKLVKNAIDAKNNNNIEVVDFVMKQATDIIEKIRNDEKVNNDVTVFTIVSNSLKLIETIYTTVHPMTSKSKMSVLGKQISNLSKSVGNGMGSAGNKMSNLGKGFGRGVGKLASYSTGGNVSTYLALFIVIVIWLIVILVNVLVIKNNKSVPAILLYVFGAVGTIIVWFVKIFWLDILFGENVAKIVKDKQDALKEKRMRKKSKNYGSIDQQSNNQESVSSNHSNQVNQSSQAYNQYMSFDDAMNNKNINKICYMYKDNGEPFSVDCNEIIKDREERSRRDHERKKILDEIKSAIEYNNDIFAKVKQAEHNAQVVVADAPSIYNTHQEAAYQAAMQEAAMQRVEKQRFEEQRAEEQAMEQQAMEEQAMTRQGISENKHFALTNGESSMPNSRQLIALTNGESSISSEPDELNDDVPNDG